MLIDDARFFVPSRRVTPHVEVAPVRSWLGAARPLKPLMLVRGVIQHQLSNHPQTATMRLAQEILEVTQSAVGRVDIGVVGDVVAVVLPRRRTEWQDPYRGHAKVLDVVKLFG